MAKQEVEIVLFNTPAKKDIKKTYPELAEIEEFKDLDPSKVKFCWLVGNVTSPIFQMERHEKIKKALSIVWGDNYAMNPTIKGLVEAKHEDDIPDDILKGIYRMNNFDPSYRTEAKLMDEYIFATLKELIIIPESDKKMMDIDDRKKYADLVIKVSSELKGMIDRIENAYGVKTIDRKTKKEVKVDINNVMNS